MGNSLKDIDLYGVYSKWFSGCGAFRCFFRSPNFVSLKHYSDFVLKEVSYKDRVFLDRLKSYVNKYDYSKTLFIVEFLNTISLDIAHYLFINERLKPVLTFNNILHPKGLVGSEEYISKLVLYSEAMSENSVSGYTIILDQNRYGDYSEDELRMNFNNQYDLTEDDLPSVEMLGDLGYDNIVYLYSLGMQMKEDISDYLEYLKSNNFIVVKEEFDVKDE
jgi:hypothetical protein